MIITGTYPLETVGFFKVENNIFDGLKHLEINGDIIQKGLILHLIIDPEKKIFSLSGFLQSLTTPIINSLSIDNTNDILLLSRKINVFGEPLNTLFIINPVHRVFSSRCNERSSEKHKESLGR